MDSDWIAWMYCWFEMGCWYNALELWHCDGVYFQCVKPPNNSINYFIQIVSSRSFQLPPNRKYIMCIRNTISLPPEIKNYPVVKEYLFYTFFTIFSPAGLYLMCLPQVKPIPCDFNILIDLNKKEIYIFCANRQTNASANAIAPYISVHRLRLNIAQ